MNTKESECSEGKTSGVTKTRGDRLESTDAID